MNRPIKIKIEGQFKGVGEKRASINCDDYILIYSEVNGATYDPDSDKEPSLTREVSAGIGGFPSAADMYDRLTQATVQMFQMSNDQKVNDYNLINYICNLINFSGLGDKVTLSVSEEYMANAGKAPIPKEERG